MTTPRFDDEQVFEMKEELIKKQMALKTFSLTYSTKNKVVQTYVNGINGIPQHEEYYDNVEDNIVFTDFSWFSSFCHIFQKVNFSADIEVLPDGNFQHSNIKLNISAAVVGDTPDKPFIMKSLYPFFERLMPFKQFITNVEFSGNKHCLRTVSFDLELDAKKVSPILKEKLVNKQMLSQWMATLDHVIDYNKDRYRFIHNVPVINGRMNMINSAPTICFQFKQKSVVQK